MGRWHNDELCSFLLCGQDSRKIIYPFNYPVIPSYNILDMATKEKPKSKPKPSPTPQQRKVLQHMVAKGGTMKAAMLEAGYSPKYAKNPKKFRLTASFQELLDENLPDWLLTEKHLELMDAKTLDHYVFPKSTDDEEIKELIEGKWGFEVMKISVQHNWKRAYFSIPDNTIRLRAVQEGYKIKNKYEPAEDTLIIRNYSDLSDEELAELHDKKTKRKAEKRND